MLGLRRHARTGVHPPRARSLHLQGPLCSTAIKVRRQDKAARRTAAEEAVLAALPRRTEAEIEAARSPRGGFSRAGLEQLGVPWPPPAGWRQALLRGEDSAA